MIRLFGSETPTTVFKPKEINKPHKLITPADKGRT